MLFQRGELRKRARQKNLLTDAIQLADNDDFADVQVITLSQHAKERAFERAWKECAFPGDVEDYAQHLLETEYTHAKEFVDVSLSGIQVGINVSEIDDHAIDKAIVLLAEAPSLTETKYYEFGEQVKINAPQRPQT